MLRTIDLRGRDLSTADLLDAVPRARAARAEALSAAADIVADVRERGEIALREQAARFDGAEGHAIRVPAEHLAEALERLDPRVRAALDEAIRRVRIASAAQVPAPRVTELEPGARIEQRWQPVRRAGVYVPGGKAVYPSSVVMNVVPAQVAGVGEVALASPPQAEFGGLPHPTILAACYLLGIREVYAVGGAQAVGMFAHGATGEPGTSDGEILCEPVDVVTGPGNIFVAAAKRLVHGVVGIDAEAGTTEIAVVADASANPEFVAADLLSQAEHDPAAASVLITDSEEFADAVDAALARRADATKHRERVHTALTGPQSGTVLVDNLDAAIAVANAYGAEHLEIQTANAASDARRIYNAGAIFVGPYNPVPLGDYMAGSNHVLPTGGTASFASGLNVHAFIKSVQEIEYTKDAMAQMYEPLRALATNEDLPAHAEALAARLTD